MLEGVFDGKLRKWLFCSTAIYLLIPLIQHWYPTIGSSLGFFVYLLSLLAIVPVIILMGAWGAFRLIYSRVKKQSLSTRNKFQVFLAVSTVAIVFFVAGIIRVVEGALPTGSHLKGFDSEVWKAEDSVKPEVGGITVRQMMLKSVVEDILPNRTKPEIEELLGPSLDTGYFKSTGRDLIYYLGNERDVFFSMDSEWLLIWISKDGKFQRYGLYSD